MKQQAITVLPYLAVLRPSAILRRGLLFETELCWDLRGQAATVSACVEEGCKKQR